jgi:hypothetical protein
MEKLLEVVFSVQFMPRLYNEDQQPVDGKRSVVVVVGPLLSLKRRPNFKTHKSLGKIKDMVMGPDMN